MGGANSGTWPRWNRKLTIEECQRIEMPYLRKMGYLKAGFEGALYWSVNGKPSGSVGIKIDDRKMELNYKARFGDADWENIRQVIKFIETPCNYGGVRKWFECPTCGNRVGLLCRAGKYFQCRHCSNLTYSSCSEHWIERKIRKRNKIKKTLGGTTSDQWIPNRPKGMHNKTYNRHYDNFVDLDEQTELAIAHLI